MTSHIREARLQTCDNVGSVLGLKKDSRTSFIGSAVGFLMILHGVFFVATSVNGPLLEVTISGALIMTAGIVFMILAAMNNRAGEE